jgi:hypothetical protein
VVNAEDCGAQYSTVPGNTCTSKNYDLTVNRASPSDVATLSDLLVNGVTVSGFAPTNYGPYAQAAVSYATTSINISAVATGPNATISGDLGVKNLVVGDNTFTGTVPAEDGPTTEN